MLPKLYQQGAPPDDMEQEAMFEEIASPEREQEEYTPSSAEEMLAELYAQKAQADKERDVAVSIKWATQNLENRK